MGFVVEGLVCGFFASCLAVPEGSRAAAGSAVGRSVFTRFEAPGSDKRAVRVDPNVSAVVGALRSTLCQLVDSQQWDHSDEHYAIEAQSEIIGTGRQA